MKILNTLDNFPVGCVPDNADCLGDRLGTLQTASAVAEYFSPVRFCLVNVQGLELSHIFQAMNIGVMASDLLSIT